MLTIVKMSPPEGPAPHSYVNSLWKIQKDPYGGDVINAYNDGTPEPGKEPMGPFYEFESSSPGAQLDPGESITRADAYSSSLMVALSQSQNYSASRVSSYLRQGGPRDNFWIPMDGREVTLADIKGPGAITHIWMIHRGGSRDLILRIYWEGNAHPSVEASIGDFFGVAMGLDAVMNSILIQVSSEGR